MNPIQTIRPELLTLSMEQLYAILPAIIVFFGSILAIFAAVTKSAKWPVFLITLLTLGSAFYFSLDLFHAAGSLVLFNGMLISDSYSNFFNLVFLGSGFLTAMGSFRYLDREKLQYPEYFVLILFAVLGMMLMISAIDMIVVFIALEIMSLAVYVLVGFRRADRRSNEAAMKYFILGSAASAVLLYGTALLYGTVGSTGIRPVATFLQSNPNAGTPVLVLGVAMVLFGFLFKVAAAPFHMWMPDVYEGAPAPITGFMTTGLKAAAFAVFVRVFITLGYGNGLSASIQAHFHDILWASAVLTMVVGNAVALTQTNLKRMLAYSSIAHTGYLLVGIVAGPRSEQGYAPVIMYLVAYAAMNLGAFVVLTLLANRDDSGLNLYDVSGLSRRHPALAFSLAVFLFSMAGIPPTAGFAAKYMLFYSAIQAHEITLVVISVLCSAISVYYYLRVLVFMYMRDPVESPSASRSSAWSTAVIVAMVFMTFQMGILPARIIAVAKKAVMSL